MFGVLRSGGVSINLHLNAYEGMLVAKGISSLLKLIFYIASLNFMLFRTLMRVSQPNHELF